MSEPAVETREFLGVTFTPLAMDEAVGAIIARAQSDAPFAYVVTPNVNHVVGLAREAERQALYDQAFLTSCDSRILELLARRSDVALPVLVGADLTARLFDQVIQKDEPVVVVGADEDVIAALQARFGLSDVRWHAPPMGLRRNPQAIANATRFIAANRARFVFLAVGCPQQEIVAKAALDRGDCVGVGLCIGASLDFLAGRVQRAPMWMQRARLEWLFRLLAEPRRLWRRYLVEGPKIFGLWLKWRKAQADVRRASIAARNSS
jgi:exopolysaccharide biosynthesis WecB/TagA/CpsF family protein